MTLLATVPSTTSAPAIPGPATPAPTAAAPAVAATAMAATALGGIRHGLVDPANGCRDLDAVLEAARAAERAGAPSVAVPASSGTAVDGGRTWPSTAQALAVLLGTDHVRVVLPVDAARCDLAALTRFARSAAGLAAGRLVVQLHGPGAHTVAAALSSRWDGEVLVGTGAVRLDAVSAA